MHPPSDEGAVAPLEWDRPCGQHSHTLCRGFCLHGRLGTESIDVRQNLYDSTVPACLHVQSREADVPASLAFMA
eukprot:365947-Chlamydomonas_euryale.AAC.8